MIEPEYLKFFSSLGVGGILAGMIFFYSRKDTLAHKEEILKREDTCEKREDTLIQVITKNTEGFEKLCNAIGTLSIEIRKAEELKLQQIQQLLQNALK